MDWLRILLFTLVLLCVLATVLPVWRTSHWWVRIWDFPRFQVAIVAMATILGTIVLRPPASPLDWLVLVAAVAVVVWQFAWIYPYLPGALRVVPSCDRDECDFHRIG